MSMSEAGWDISMIILVITAIAGVATAVATWYTGILESIKNEKKSKLKIDKFKDEINSFAQWYMNTKPALNELWDSSCKEVLTEEILKKYKKRIIMFSGSLNYWKSNKVEIIVLLKNKFGESVSNACELLMENIISFNYLHCNMLALMGEDNNKSMPFSEFCNHFIDLCPEEMICQFGGEDKNFNSCLREKMILLEKSYEAVGEKIGLNPLSLRGKNFDE